MPAARLMAMPFLNLPGGGACPVGLVSWVPPLIEKDWNNPLLGGPFDGDDNEGLPLVPEQPRRQVLQRLFPALVQAMTQDQPPASPPSTSEQPR